jgi:DNA-binding SARP family transcriptional activator/class 3 adenylate cyclase
MRIEFRILGPLEVGADGGAVALGSPKQRALLALLLVHANETLSRDRLIEELWGDAQPASVESALHVYLSRLRRVLDSAGAGSALVRDAYGYKLRVEPEQLDAERFARLVGEGSEVLAAGKADFAGKRFREALALWRGPALADLQSERFAITASARLDEQRVSALEQRLEADLALGRDRELIGELETLVAEHPYRERLRAQLMLALYRSGRQAEALSAYREARCTLADELGLEPSQELKQLEQAILRQDATLTLAPPVNLEIDSKPPPAPPAAVPPAREERKVVTVLFADLVGFTAQAERLDPEDVRAIQDRYWAPVRAEIERHGGTVEKFVGDAVMALFGAPRAHEDDPERAVRAALAIRGWARGEGLEVRIAATTGEALVRLGAQPLAGEGMAAGDVVNSAARLQAAAPVNGILVGDRTRRATDHVIDYQERSPVEVKGRAEPILVWEALRARSRVGVDTLHHVRTPLIGRGRELELLCSTIARVREERAPQLVTLIGVPGIGKSRLVYELMVAVARDPSVIIAWRQGRSLPYGDGVSFWALAEIVKAQAEVLETDSVERSGQKLGRTVRTLLGDEREAEWIERHLRPLAGLTADGAAAGDSRLEAFAAWRRFLEALADWRPLVLVFEDLHWADDGLLDFVDGLVEWVSGVPLLVIATARPELLERRPGWAGGKPNAFTLSLPPLSEEETTSLVTALLGDSSSLASEAQLALLANAGGNPLYAEQYVRVLSEQTEGFPVPETVQAVIAARVDALPTPEKTLLQDAAVFGKVFWSGAAAGLQGIDGSTAEAYLHALERKEFVQRARRSSVADEGEYAFRHLLIRDVAYGQIPRAVRASKHQQAAAWIESLGRNEDHAELLAHHYLNAVKWSRLAGAANAGLAVRARAALRQAGDRALALYAYAAAARHYERAAKIAADPDPDRPRAMLHHAQALQALGDGRRFELLEEAHQALLAAGDEEGAVEADLALVESWWSSGDDERCVEHLDRAAALVREREPTVAKARATTTLARFRMMFGHLKEGLRFAQEGLELAKATGLPELEARNLITIGTIRSHDDSHGGLAELERGIEIARDAGAIRELARGLTNLAYWYEGIGDLRRSEALGAESLVLHERLGQVELIRFGRGNMVGAFFASGRWDETERLATEFLAESEAGSPHVLDAYALGLRSRIRLGRNQEDAAIEDASRALETARRSRDSDIVVSALETMALVQSELGATEEAAALLDELLPHAIQYPHLIRSGWPSVVLVAERVGRTTEIRAILDGLQNEIRWRIAAQDTLDGRHADAADHYAEIGTLPDEAYERLRAARTFAAAGRPAEADNQTRRSLAFFRSAGATRYIREAELLLAGSQSAPRKAQQPDRSI